MLPIYVVNNYGQFNHLILRMLRDCGIDAEIVPNTRSPDEIATGCRGVILGGGPTLSRAGRCPEYLGLGIPVLGICLGLHVLAQAAGSSIRPGKAGGYGAVTVDILEPGGILEGYPAQVKVWASHADEVADLPPGFTLLARSDICSVEAVAEPDRHIYGLQWHPEVSHTENGRLVYENFDRITREVAGR